MGPRLGKFSKRMSDENLENKDRRGKDIMEENTPSDSSNSPPTQDSEESPPVEPSSSSSSSSSSGGSLAGTSGSGWNSENWAKKRKALLERLEHHKSRLEYHKSKRESFFGRKNKKWPMRGSSSKNKEDAPPSGSVACVCTGYRKTNADDPPPASSSSNPPMALRPIIDLSRFNPANYPIDDEDERMRQQRAKEIAEGVELSAIFGDLTLKHDNQPFHAHTQIDYIHCLVPDLKEITSCSFYWGKIDRYEAEKLLEGKPEGTFLLRDSAQEEYLFSVSFRRYGRSLHARIEQWNHTFSFDSHDPSVFSSPTVTGLIKHYKDPSCCMFFEPMLTTPLHRVFPFDLQHLARSVICSNVSYDSINTLPLPKSLKMYCKEYHYKQRVRVRRLE